jgi:hypothetical protein
MRAGRFAARSISFSGVRNDHDAQAVRSISRRMFSVAALTNANRASPKFLRGKVHVVFVPITFQTPRTRWFFAGGH